MASTETWSTDVERTILRPRMPLGKSDSLVVLGARESRAHGEAAGPRATVWGHNGHTQRWNTGEHDTGQDNEQSST